MRTAPSARLLLVAALLACAGSALAQNWKPTRPINLIVPWAPGGSTDQITRVTAAELEKALGQTIVVVNQPGASGSIGTKSAFDAPRDGYTWTAGAAQDLGTYQTLGSLNTSIKDWHLFLTVANIQVIGVNPSTPYQNPKQLLDAMKAKPGAIPVATAGVTSAGHNAMELIAKATGVTYRHVTYDGGNPAVVATVAGEAEVTTQLAVEQADMIRGKRLRPLATVSDKPLELEGYGTIPPLSETLPGFTAPANYFGIFIPEGRARRRGQDGREDLGRARSARARRSRSTRRAAAPCSRRRRARRRRRRCSRPSRPTPGCSSTAARPRSRPTRSASPSPERHARRRHVETATSPTRPAADEARAVAASDLRGALGWMVFGIAVLALSLADGPARGAAHQPVHGARDCCRGCSASSRSCSAACWPCAAGAAAAASAAGRSSRRAASRRAASRSSSA